QNAMLLAGAVATGRGDLLAAATRDRLHQPYRAPLCPLLPALQPVVGQHGILAATLSGAGPSVLLWLEHAGSEVRAAVQAALTAAGLEAELIPATIAARGPGMDWKS
ncbi:MAG: homoserine kinase, partial [Terriglobales bacterium]